MPQEPDHQVTDLQEVDNLVAESLAHRTGTWTMQDSWQGSKKGRISSLFHDRYPCITCLICRGRKIYTDSAACARRYKFLNSFQDGMDDLAGDLLI
jgi:hypothetical protein